jgi:hypothetical protein
MKTVGALTRSVDLEIDTGSAAAEKASQIARATLLEQKDLLFSPIYGKVNEDVMRWWFAVDLAKKFLVSVAVAFGENGLSDHKSEVFLIIGTYVVLYSTYSPSPSPTENFFEMTSSVCIMVMIYWSSVSELKDRLQNVLATMMVVLVTVATTWWLGEMMPKLRAIANSAPTPTQALDEIAVEMEAVSSQPPSLPPSMRATDNNQRYAPLQGDGEVLPLSPHPQSQSQRRKPSVYRPRSLPTCHPTSPSRHNAEDQVQMVDTSMGVQ